MSALTDTEGLRVREREKKKTTGNTELRQNRTDDLLDWSAMPQSLTSSMLVRACPERTIYQELLKTELRISDF